MAEIKGPVSLGFFKTIKPSFRNCKERSPTEQFYVVPLNRVYRLLNSHAKVQKCFSFFHPNCKQQYSQQAELLFDIDVACDVSLQIIDFKLFLGDWIFWLF